MSTVIENLEKSQLRSVPSFRPGDRVRVHFQVIEGTRKRTQVFEGVVIKRQGAGVRETFTVRKLSFGVGVERTFPVHSPKIDKIEVSSRGDVRRAKLYYLRDRVGKAARVRERSYVAVEEEQLVEAETAEAGTAEAEAGVDTEQATAEAAAGSGGDQQGGAEDQVAAEGKPEASSAAESSSSEDQPTAEDQSNASTSTDAEGKSGSDEQASAKDESNAADETADPASGADSDEKQ